jgi:hypothetical protein
MPSCRRLSRCQLQPRPWRFGSQRGVLICDNGNLVHGTLNDDEYARTHFDLSAKQLRNTRNAATSEALRRQAGMLGVPLPPNFVDRLPHPLNGQRLARARS